MQAHFSNTQNKHMHTHALSHTHQLQIALDGSLDGSSGGGVRLLVVARQTGRGEGEVGRREGERREKKREKMVRR